MYNYNCNFIKEASLVCFSFLFLFLFIEKVNFSITIKVIDLKSEYDKHKIGGA